MGSPSADRRAAIAGMSRGQETRQISQAAKACRARLAQKMNSSQLVKILSSLLCYQNAISLEITMESRSVIP